TRSRYGHPANAQLRKGFSWKRMYRARFQNTRPDKMNSRSPLGDFVKNPVERNVRSRRLGNVPSRQLAIQRGELRYLPCDLCLADHRVPFWGCRQAKQGGG